MYMIRHDDPGNQPVTLTVEMLKGGPNDNRIRVIAKNARAAALVDHRIKFPASVSFIGCFSDQPAIDCAGQTVGQPECDRLHNGTVVEMGKVSTTVPRPMRAGRKRSRG